MLVRILQGQTLLSMGVILLARGSVGYDTYVFLLRYIGRISDLARGAAFLLVACLLDWIFPWLNH